MSVEHTAQATSLKKDIDKILKDVKKKLKDKDNDEKQDEKEDEKQDEKEAKTDNGYGFSDEGDTKREDFNFVAAGDYGCSKNTKNTINNMNDKKPELVLPLGDLSVDNTTTFWLDLTAPFDDKLK